MLTPWLCRGVNHVAMWSRSRRVTLLATASSASAHRDDRTRAGYRWWIGPPSVGPERGDGMDPAGAAGRQVGGEKGRGAEDERRPEERQRVDRVDLEQQPAQQARRGAGDGQP